MSDGLVYALIGIGLLAIAGLLVFIVRKIAQLRSRRRQAAEDEARLQELQVQARVRAQEQRAYLIESIRVIARAMSEDERLTLTEGCIRLKVLLDNLMPELHQNPDFSIIASHYEATRHIPFLDAWKQLDRREQRRFRREMELLENENREALLSAAGKLHAYPLERMH